MKSASTFEYLYPSVKVAASKQLLRVYFTVFIPALMLI